jgi:hypothetical protein
MQAFSCAAGPRVGVSIKAHGRQTAGMSLCVRQAMWKSSCLGRLVSLAPLRPCALSEKLQHLSWFLGKAASFAAHLNTCGTHLCSMTGVKSALRFRLSPMTS